MWIGGRRLRPGQTRGSGWAALCLAALCGAALAESAPSAEVEVRFDFIVPNQGLPVALQLAGTLRLRQPADRMVERILPFRVGTPIVVRLPTGTAWEASVDLAGHWARREVVEIPANGAGGPVIRRLRLWPLGSIQGIVRATARTPPLPRVVVVTTLPARAGGAGDAPPGSIACPIDAKGAWKCELPAVKYDLAIAAQGFVPHYRWGVTVPSDRPLSLGVLELEPGASVAGWVEVPDGSIDPARCRARLAPAMAPGASGQENAQRVLQTASEVQVGKEGFFQVGGLRAGSYSLVVEQPGYAPGKTAPIQVSEAQETFLREPLVLWRKLSLELSIDPALDWLDRPWRVAILRKPHSTSTLKYSTVFDGSAGTLSLRFDR